MEERELIRKSQEGDEESFTQLLLLYRPRIMKHCIDLLKDDGLAEDLTQEATLRAFRKLGTFRLESEFGTWLWRIAHNLCLDHLRKKKEMTTDQLDLREEKPRGNQDMLYQECLEHLPYKQREVFELYYIHQLSQQEIAKRLNIPHGTVRSRLYYAKRRLRVILNK